MIKLSTEKVKMLKISPEYHFVSPPSPHLTPIRFTRNPFVSTPNHFLGKSPHTLPVTIQKTGQAVVIGLGEKDAVAGQVSKAVGKIADYIESVGY